MNNEKDLYGTEDSDNVHDTIKDAIDHLEEDQFPAQVVLFRRMKPNPKALASRILEWAIEDLDEDLDEDLSDPEGGATTKTPAMVALAEKFADDLCGMHVPWACEPTGNAVWVNMDGEIVEEPK